MFIIFILRLVQQVKIRDVALVASRNKNIFVTFIYLVTIDFISSKENVFMVLVLLNYIISAPHLVGLCEITLCETTKLHFP